MLEDSPKRTDVGAHKVQAPRQKIVQSQEKLVSLAREAKLVAPEVFMEARPPKEKLRASNIKEQLAAFKFLMAPMAGVTDAAYRLMQEAGGAKLCYSEMVSVAGLHYNGEKSWELVYPDERESPLAVQLFGTNPEQFREAAESIVERLGEKLALIDVNMACPVPKVTKKGEGSAMLDTPELAAEIIKTLVSVCEKEDIPVTAKIRRSRVAGPELAPDFAKALEQAGVSAIAVHGRSASQMYRGESDWTVIDRVAEAVSVPIIGSGDVMSAEAAVRMLQETAATAVMVARGSYGNPWIFNDAQEFFENKVLPEHSILERLSAYELQLRLLAETGANIARGRSLAGWYSKGVAHGASWRQQSMEARSLDDFLAHIAELKSHLAEDLS